jgi:hypothetical protein
MLRLFGYPTESQTVRQSDSQKVTQGGAASPWLLGGGAGRSFQSEAPKDARASFLGIGRKIADAKESARKISQRDGEHWAKRWAFRLEWSPCPLQAGLVLRCCGV